MPESPTPWISDDDLVLVTDLYELSMLHAYWRSGMDGKAVFSLFFWRLPAARNYVLAAGLDTTLACLERLHFSAGALAHLKSLGRFPEDFLAHLAGWRFTGDVYALPEGTPVFAGEPLLEIVAPIGEGQLVETLVMNQIHCQSVLASKAARVVASAQGRPVLDFGLRRMHGAEAGLHGARAFHIAGVSATSNVLAGQRYGLPVAGTMTHSFVQACPDELEAFRRRAALEPDTVLLVDTYDTLEGVRNVIRLAQELGDGFRIRGIRLDSGDLLGLSREARALLDAAGLQRVQIVASGGLDEHRIAELLRGGAPIDGFGVGTRMGVSADAPELDLAYKLVSYEEHDRVKTAAEKRTYPGRKQVWRRVENGVAAGDTVTAAGEDAPGTPLLVKVMEGGRRLPEGRRSLDVIRARCTAALAQLPAALRALEPAAPYPVSISPRLQARQRELAARMSGGGNGRKTC